VGGWSLFITDYAKMIVFPGKTLLKITRGIKIPGSHANKRAWHIKRAIIKIEAVGF